MNYTEPNPIRYDAHCHVMSREVFFKRIVMTFIDLAKDFDFKKSLDSKNKLDADQSDAPNIFRLLKLLLENKNGVEAFNDLVAEYAKLDPSIQKYMPLMVDFEYLFRTKYHVEDETLEDVQNRKDQLTDFMVKFDIIRKKIKKVIAKEHTHAGNNRLELLTQLIKETEENSNPKDNDAVDAQLALDIKSYQRQLETFRELKKLHGDNLNAFLAVDPRRPDMMDIIKENVGKDKTFTGIKLYPPMGYSPTDPFLYGKDGQNDCLYKYCIDNHLPIVTHCSAGGFCTFVQHLEVIGAVMPDMKFTSQPVNYTKVTEIKFKTNVLKSFGDAVKERAYRLNHPKLWEMVLDKFPTLKIDLAHFGGDPDEYGNERRDYIFKLMMKKNDAGQPKYPNFYTDLSCILEKTLLQDIYKSKYSQIPERFMYGSDYFLNLIWDENFKTYYQNFVDVFGGELDRIGRENVEGFLKIEIDKPMNA